MKKIIFVLFIAILLVTVSTVGAAGSNNYSLDYLLRHYTVVTFGANTNSTISTYNQKVANTGKGDVKDLTVNGSVLAKGSYPNKVNVDVDFDAMYVQVINESNKLLENATGHINSYLMTVDSPGIYTVDNTARNSEYNYYRYKKNGNSYISSNYGRSGDKGIYINDYQPDKLYVFNFVDTIAVNNIKIYIAETGAPSAISFYDFVESGKYKGNIILNYPNARYLETEVINGSIIAPKADVYIDSEYPFIKEYNGPYSQSHYLIGGIYANSVTHKGDLELTSGLLTSSEQIHNELGGNYKVEVKDFTDDAYYGDYSISTILKNYNLVTLGQNNYQSNSKLASLNVPNGSASVFHIASQFLINGNLGVKDVVYNNSDRYAPRSIRVDLESNEINESYIAGSINKYQQVGNKYLYDLGYYIKYWELNSDHRSSRNDLFIKSSSYNRSEDHISLGGGITYIPDDYINFGRLYNTIVEEQKRITDGTVVTPKNGVIHIRIGGNYTIEDVSNVREIMFEGFDTNKDELTIVTIKNSGSINFPLISKDTGAYKGIVTNDYYGKAKANQRYEAGGLLPDEYHGNIVFNVPNANYIKLRDDAPFVGHLIAPKADLETEEIQIAGCMIVNSLYSEGSSELHFYPITVKLPCDCEEYHSLSDELKLRLSDEKLYRLLGGTKDEIERVIIGDQSQYREDMNKIDNALSKCVGSGKTNNILTNPMTYANALLIILITGVIIWGFVHYKKKARS